MDKGDLLSFLRSQRWAIEATVSTAQAPQAAIIGIVTTDQFELVFDTRDSSRGHQSANQPTCGAGDRGLE
jgi:hypothetical protein